MVNIHSKKYKKLAEEIIIHLDNVLYYQDIMYKLIDNIKAIMFKDEIRYMQEYTIDFNDMTEELKIEYYKILELMIEIYYKKNLKQAKQMKEEMKCFNRENFIRFIGIVNNIGK